jgi:hypothetical protein
VNRVLGLVSGETQQKQRMEHQQALVEAMHKGAQQALQGVVQGMHESVGAGIPSAGIGGGDPTSAIRGLMSQAGGAPPAGPQGGMARGGYPDLIGLPEPEGLPIREHFAHGGMDFLGPRDKGDFGGGSHGFQPPNGSTGRSDNIEARLSPNEYVMDAETVSALGDGSPDAGAAKLDKFRANVRRHKGKALAKGKFSPDAHEPESYL